MQFVNSVCLQHRGRLFNTKLKEDCVIFQSRERNKAITQIVCVIHRDHELLSSLQCSVNQKHFLYVYTFLVANCLKAVSRFICQQWNTRLIMQYFLERICIMIPPNCIFLDSWSGMQNLYLQVNVIHCYNRSTKILSCMWKQLTLREIKDTSIFFCFPSMRTLYSWPFECGSTTGNGRSLNSQYLVFQMRA